MSGSASSLGVTQVEVKLNSNLGVTYQLGAGCTETECGEWILCLACNRRSFHPQDVAERYCARCHVFLDEPARQLEVA